MKDRIREARMASSTRTVLLVLMGALMGAAATLAHSVWAEGEGNGQAVPTDELPLEQLRTFTDVFSRIQDNYVEEISDEQLIEYAIDGMVASLDPHSDYLDPREFKELQIGTQGEFGGLGIEVTLEDGFVKVVAPIDDTPAKRSGMQSGDLIVRLNGESVKGMSLNEAVQIMRGEPGTDIQLTVIREGRDEPIQVSITRAVIEVESVDARTLESGYGYLRVSHFQNNTQDAVDEALRKLAESNGGSLDGLVLDLRNNPGGVLSAAVSLADTFLEEGLVVYTEGRTQGSAQRYSARPGDAIHNAPLVVLVNEGSASASEIVAGAIQDQERGLVLGKQTFGKGSVQTIQDLQGGGALKLTTAQYFTPDGTSIQAEGIKPDLETGQYKLQAIQEEGVGALSEANLSRHLENPDAKQGAGDGGNSSDGDGSGGSADGDGGDLAVDDYELYFAVNVLKGLHILQAGR